MPPAKKDRFPILCLSALPLECVAKQLMCRDIFQFSVISKDCFDAMKDAIRSTPKSKSMFIILTENKFQLTLDQSRYYNGDESETVEWNFNGTWNRRRRWNVELYWGPQPKTLVFREKTKGRYVTASNSVEELLQLAEHIGNLFRAFTYRITMSSEYCHFLPTIQRVPVLQQTRELNASYGIINHDTMLRLLTGFRTRLLCIDCDVEPNFQLQLNGPIRTKELVLSKCSWFTAPLFHNFKGSRLVLYDCILTNSDFNTFLRNWKASRRRRRSNLQFDRIWNRGNGYGPNINPELQRRWDEEKWDVARITEGLEDIRHVPGYPLTNSNFMFKRQTDGMILSLYITSEHFSGRMSMMFYYESN